jgi:hypothetical protein
MCIAWLRSIGMSLRHISARVEYLYNKITRIQVYLSQAMKFHDIAVEVQLPTCDNCISVKK